MVTTKTIGFTCAQNHRQETHKDKLREQIQVFVELKIFAMRRHRTRERGAKWNIRNPLEMINYYNNISTQICKIIIIIFLFTLLNLF